MCRAVHLLASASTAELDLTLNPKPATRKPEKVQGFRRYRHTVKDFTRSHNGFFTRIVRMLSGSALTKLPVWLHKAFQSLWFDSLLYGSERLGVGMQQVFLIGFWKGVVKALLSVKGCLI